MSKHNAEVDCTRRCKSRRHGQALTSAITKRSVSDQALASFIRGTCANFPQVFDYEGCTALHMSASRGRASLVDWLVRHSTEPLYNIKDRESGYTPLHRALFYGQIHVAVHLIKIGVNTELLDKDDFRPLAHAMLDRHYMHKGMTGPCDAYVWGTNSNYTLGTGTQHQRTVPELLNCFSRTGDHVLQACLGKFHSVWICAGREGGAASACGQLGRAGAPPGTALRPVVLRLPEPCAQAALMLDSTVFLLSNGTVIQYSLNNTDTSVSSNKTPSCIKLPSVKPILKLSEPLGVCSSKHHAVVWNVNAVYTWGTNVGQLGHSQKEGFVATPKRVAIQLNNGKEEAKIQLVSCSEAATVATSSRGDVYLLHKHLAKKIAVKQINLRQVCVDAKISDNGVCSRITVLLLTNVGQLHIWTDAANRLTRCVFGLAHQTTITHVALSHEAMYFTTKYGEAYIGHISRKSMSVSQPTPKKDKERDSGKSALVKFLEKEDCTSVRVSRIANVHRAVSIAVDSEGSNFVCLQVKPTCGLTSLPELSPSSMSKQMGTLLEIASEDDLLHDVVFKVGTKTYPAHMYIIASGSDLLFKQYEEKKSIDPTSIPVITLENVHQDVFDRILRYLYTGTCDVTQTGPCLLKLKKEDLIKDEKKEKEIDFDNEDVIESPSEMSAFELYKQEKVKKNARNKRANATPPRAHTHFDPVKLLQAAAKRLQVMSLHKLLDRFYYRDGTIYLKDNSSAYTPTPHLDRGALPALVDTHVVSKDGCSVPAHKCLLAARLDYFNAMFMHSWTESSLLSTVSLPINHAILRPIIDFLYTDHCPEVEASDNLDFICSLLIVSDQLFISRLREMCEVSIASLVTLKNCAELCQFAHTYNANQLKQHCMEFICLNLACILENRSLEMLDQSLLEDITKYYCKFNTIMHSRVITPFSTAPSDDVIEKYAKSCPVNLEYTDEDVKREDLTESKKKNRKKTEYTENEKAKKRYESVTSVTSLDLSNDTGDITLSLSKIADSPKEKDKWIKVPTTQQKVQARLKAISSAKEILNESPVESFVTLSKTNSFTSHDGSPQFSRLSISPKESSFADLARSPPGNITISHIGPKLSQKQRKRLASQGNETTQSLDEYLSSKLSLESPPQPRNPWKVIEAPATSSRAPHVARPTHFQQILADQKKQKDDSSRIMTKPLGLTQLEDKAIEELERFYNIHEIDDELISVQRIELQVAAPRWITAAKSGC